MKVAFYNINGKKITDAAKIKNNTTLITIKPRF